MSVKLKPVTSFDCNIWNYSKFVSESVLLSLFEALPIQFFLDPASALFSVLCPECTVDLIILAYMILFDIF